VLGDVQIGGAVTNVTIGGALDSQFSATGTITKLAAGSLGPDALLSSEEGSILTLTTVRGMDGQVTAAQYLGTVRSGGGIGATLQAELDIRSVFSAGDITSDGGFTAGRDIKKVEATGRLATNLEAGRHISTLKAAAIDGGVDGIRIAAGSEVGAKADVGTVTVGAGGIVNAEIWAARNVTKVTTTGGLANAWIVAGVEPGVDGQYGRYDGPPKDAAENAATDNDLDLKVGGKVSTVAANSYLGDVRVVSGGKLTPKVTIGGTRRNMSEASPNAVTGPNFLTLIRSVRRPDGQYESAVV